MINPQRGIKIVGLLIIVCFLAALGMGCTCFTEATAEPPEDSCGPASAAASAAAATTGEV